jgi:ribosomal protein S21
MTVEVKRKGTESSESLLRRFSKKVLQSGVIWRAKKARFYQRPKTKRELKEEALRRLYIQKKREYLQKIGKLVEEDSLSYGSGKYTQQRTNKIK